MLLLGGWELASGEPFSLTTRTESPPETGEITCCDVSSPLGKFTFMAPRGWRVKVVGAADRLCLTSPDFTANLEIGFTAGSPNSTPKASTEVLRPQVLERFPGAAILEEFTCYTASESGLGFVLSWKLGKDARCMARIAFVPCPGGMIEFCLTTSPDRYPDCQPSFGTLLTSFSRSSLEKAPAASGQ